MVVNVIHVFIRDICADHDKVFASNLVLINFLI